MEKYSDVVVNTRGVAVSGASVVVTNYPSGTPATIYLTDGGMPTTAAISTGANGVFSFYAADGHYSLTVSGAGITTTTKQDIVLSDASSLALPSGSINIGEKSYASASSATTVHKKFKDFGISLRADYLALGDGIADDTSAVQKFMNAQEINVLTGYVPEGFYSVSAIQLGNLATTDTRYPPSGQGPGIFHLRGVDRQLAKFVARPGVSILAQRKNLAGAKISQVGFDANSNADVALDLTWDITPTYPGAPSNNNVLTDVYAIGAKICNIKLTNFYDSTVENLRSVGAPIALILSGGGGQLNMNNCLFDGLVQISAQNLAISNTPMLAGLDINGNAINRISLEGCQIFPIQDSPSIPSYKTNFALDCTDSGSFGANVSAISCYFFGRVNCIQGKFSHGFTAENCTFDYGASGSLLANVIGGTTGKPLMRFVNCSFPADGTPLGTSPAEYNWEMVNCFVGGNRIQYASNMTEGFWTPTGVGVVFPAGTTLGRWYRSGNMMNVFCDVTWPNNVDTSPAVIFGIPLAISGTLSAASFGLNTYTANQLTAYVNGFNIYLNIASTNTPPTNATMSNKRVMIHASYPVTTPLAGI